MSNFRIEFLNSPWWLLLLIPAIFLTLFPYFRIDKKYRRNRNRIISMVCHLTIMVLCITVLSGMHFTYDKPNTDNEVLILVDMSDSNEQSMEDKDNFVKRVIDESASEFRIGVVTFGYDQVYAAQFSTNTNGVYNAYKNSEMPDTSATDIASALNYARSLFSENATAKVVLISDGLETDGDAMMAVRSLSANGIQIDTVHFPNSYNNDEVQLTGITLPEYNVSVDEEFTIGVSVNCRNITAGETKAILTLYDSDGKNADTELSVQEVTLVNGQQLFETKCVLKSDGLHRLHYTVKSVEESSGKFDRLNQNNDYYTYVNIQTFNKILILERDAGDSAKLVETLKDEFEVTVYGINDANNLPKTVEALCEYDEVILMNIANRDMPEGYIDILHSYVNEHGGGMFTIGGNRVNEYGKEVANTYDQQDMAGTLYQEMLPVQAIKYTPPLGVMIIIDRSGSMSGDKLEAAKAGARASLYALSERDYCGIMTLDTEFNVEQQLIPATQQAKLLRTIDDVKVGGGTMYAGAIRRAGQALLSLRNVERRHIILIGDGQAGDPFADYEAVIKNNLNSGITFTMVAIGINQNSQEDIDMRKAAEAGNGRYYRSLNGQELTDQMSQELKLPEIAGINPEPFQPRIRDHTSIVAGIEQKDIPKLGGYYGTKIKDHTDVQISLAGDYVPIYAQWRYGKGRVGSFMCDLNGEDWSAEFMNNDVGKTLIVNMVKALSPTEDIRTNEIRAEFSTDNYTTGVSIYTELAEGDRVELTVNTVALGGEDAKEIIKIAPTAEEGYTRMKFAITEPGVYEVIIKKIGADGTSKATLSIFRTFSYSEEYDAFVDPETGEQLISDIAEAGRGHLIPSTNPWDVFEDMSESLHKDFDPRWILLIIALVLFLLDIAVRKFKFKWIHEIIRERKEKKQSEK